MRIGAYSYAHGRERTRPADRANRAARALGETWRRRSRGVRAWLCDAPRRARRGADARRLGGVARRATAGACDDAGPRYGESHAAADAGRRSTAAEPTEAGADFSAAARKTAGSASSHGGSTRPGLGPRRRARLRDRRRRRHGAGHRLLLRPRSQSGLDRRGHADRARRVRVRARVHGRTGVASTLRAVLVGPRRSCGRHRRRVRDPRGRGRPLRSRTGCACASARRHDCGGGYDGRDSLALAGHRRHRTARRRACPGAPGVRYGPDVGIG